MPHPRRNMHQQIEKQKHHKQREGGPSNQAPQHVTYSRGQQRHAYKVGPKHTRGNPLWDDLHNFASVRKMFCAERAQRSRNQDDAQRGECGERVTPAEFRATANESRDQKADAGQTTPENDLIHRAPHELRPQSWRNQFSRNRLKAPTTSPQYPPDCTRTRPLAGRHKNLLPSARPWECDRVANSPPHAFLLIFSKPCCCQIAAECSAAIQVSAPCKNRFSSKTCLCWRWLRTGSFISLPMTGS